ncbi:hypothetical protein QR721_13310 [Aciduricibacillus chroicocephali]|uniref:Uncharacterized protein n=1 Tax=Aciduricibacillus chroicocephali TaxID=3054939 RepID=A0ABY9KV20_9BACI|nr:hypothetical protein QR721_13310 [Bacillaceae bacterium 44XB]
MDNLNQIIDELNLPTQLKVYLNSSEQTKEQLTVGILKEIEDLYNFYQALYLFDTSEFSAFTITSLKRCKDKETFYYYLKKVIDSNVDFKSRDTAYSHKDDCFSLQKEIVNKTFEQAVLEFCTYIDGVYKRTDKLNLTQTFINLGKLELITTLINNQNYEQILNAGKLVLEKHKLL